MYSNDGQPVDTSLDANVGQSSHSTYPQAAGSDMGYQLSRPLSLLNDTQTVSFPYHDIFPPTMMNQSLSSGEQTSALFTNESFPHLNPLGRYNYQDLPATGGFVAEPPSTFQSTDSFPDPNFINLPRDRYDHVMAGAGERSSASLIDEFALDPHAGYHPIYNPSAIPYAGSGPSHASPPQYFPAFPPPIVSIDGISTLAPDSEDIQPIGESLLVDEPLPLGDSLTVREPSPPPPPSGSHSRQPGKRPLEIKFWPYPHARPKLRGLTSAKGFSDAAPSPTFPPSSRIAPLQYSNKIRIHRKIFREARVILIRSALKDCPFLIEQERKVAALEALTSAATAYDQGYGSIWATENLSTFYKTFTVPPSAGIMSTCKKIARAVAQIGYDLCPSIWSDESEQEYQSDAVTALIDDPLFPLRYLFGNSSNRQLDKLFAFENHVLLTVVLDTILKLGYAPYITELDSLFCTAAAALESALRELASGQVSEFGVTDFKPRYTLLKEYIRDVITPNPELSKRYYVHGTYWP
ncbi:hypothetical protein BD769DRAFT_1392898 [Suillus cothurnatus]|nr:hypothetical protein BD769DRAFT_1392898 [Suillus cothurnatus]